MSSPAAFGIYIHWPFCQAKCPYCDFNSHVSNSIETSAWRAAYLSELGRYAEETNDRIVNSIFFGGGTPSLMDPELVADVIETIRKLWRTSNTLEITLEANPTSSEAISFQGFRQAGVNRLSMGIQALNNADLKKLGRLHTVEEAMTAFDLARSEFQRVSFDLIYGRQDQSLNDWEKELQTAVDMAVDHLSLYQLTIEPGTAFGDRFEVGKLKGLPSDDLGADLYTLTQDITGAAELSNYEISNHARPNSESQHNMIYWTGGDYLGVGPGAHGRLTLNSTRFATATQLSPEGWLTEVAKTGNGESTRSEISQQDQLSEYVMMALRLARGMDLNHLESIGDCQTLFHNINALEKEGYLFRPDSRHIAITPEYRILANAVIREVLV